MAKWPHVVGRREVAERPYVESSMAVRGGLARWGRAAVRGGPVRLYVQAH